MKRLGIAGKAAPTHRPGDPLGVLPYPGGRHPRIGFLEGALMPQRDTKVSVFAPWDKGGYVVVDVPEAVWSNLGLTYLAHTHVSTIWEQAGAKLPPQEWRPNADGTLEMERALPNGIAFGTKVTPGPAEVRFDMWLRNGTRDKLTGLRVQNCVMLARLAGFEAQTNENKVFRSPYAAARSADGERWVLVTFDPIQRCWGNELCPCLHSDPQFPDRDPGQTVHVRGRLWFYEGTISTGNSDRRGWSEWAAR